MSGEFHSHSQGCKFGSQYLGCVCVASLHSIFRSLSLFKLSHTQLCIPEFPTKKTNCKAGKEGLYLLCQLLLSGKDLKEAPSFVMGDASDGTLTFLDIPVLQILICCSCETTFSTPLSFFIAWDSSHKGPRCHPCPVAEGARAFSFEAHAAAV